MLFKLIYNLHIFIENNYYLSKDYVFVVLRYIINNYNNININKR